MADENTFAVYTPPAAKPYPGAHWVTEKIGSLVLTPHTPVEWIVTFGAMFTGTLGLLFAIAWLLIRGIGIWGVNIPIAWGFAIVNFVWWIGIGHAGTLISAILLLLHQAWRQSINRFAEAMTLFAVACAGLFPLLHLGRPWFFYWIAPYPNTMGLWPQWRSPLVWDMFAVSTYFTISLVFWYIGLIPDLATFRDKAKHRVTQVIYGLMAMGWRGSAYHWQRYQEAYLILAGLATPLVISVHTVVSFDFTIAIVPGWHSTIFPPYFVAGAIYSGFAMVVTLAIPLREIYGLQELITMRHLENMAKLMLATGVIVLYSYVDEAFIAFYSGNPYERFEIMNRAFGPYRCAILAVDRHEPSYSATDVVQPHAEEHCCHFPRSSFRRCGNVAGTVCHCGCQSPSRFPAVDAGACITRASGIGPPLRGLSQCSLLYSCCSSVCFRPSRCSK